MNKEDKKREFPNTYVIIFVIIAICALATWIVPGGEYINNSSEFRYVKAEGQWWEVFSAFYNGFVKQSGIIVFILIIGAAFWIVNKSRAIDAGIFSFLGFVTKLEQNKFLAKVGVNNIVIVLVMLLFSLFGAVFGMSEETIAFVIIIVPLAISMGYDSIVGLCMVYVAAHVGFAGAILNPFTIGIAQDIAGLPLFSGIEYRFFCWIVLNIITIIFVLLYASRVKRNPKKSIMYENDAYWRTHIEQTGGKVEYYKNIESKVSFVLALAVVMVFTFIYSEGCHISIGTSNIHTPWLLRFTAIAFIGLCVMALRKSVHFYVLTLLGFTIVYLIIGVLGYQWYIGEISALFLGLGILSGIAMGLSGNKIVKELMEGAKDIIGAALIVGLAAGIVFILQEGKIIDTILHSMASGLGKVGEVGSLGMMYAIQTIINIVIPSASAKAAITMPIMAPFADIIGVSRQATVMAFQFGDGFTNMITPTSGVLIAVLGIARIPYNKWFKWVLPFVLLLIFVGFLLLLPTIFISLPGF
ncbi:MAG: AbgT family transporter [Bacteroidales bacterium]